MRHDQMIQYRNLHYSARIDDFFGEIDIGDRWLEIAAGVIVREYDLCRAKHQSIPKDDFNVGGAGCLGS